MAKSVPYSWTVLADHVAPFDVPALGYVSTFTAASREARTLTGRDERSGRRTGEPVALWAGTAVYLILLEQIGKSLRPFRAREVKGEKELERAIRQFAPARATRIQRQALYALRCAFVHEFGLFNRSRRSEYQRVFALDDTVGAPLVRPPRRRWDGNAKNAAPGTSTVIGVHAVGDLVEEVIRSVRQYSNGTLLRSPFSPFELQRRFGFEIT